jgi:hypothetical protein
MPAVPSGSAAAVPVTRFAALVRDGQDLRPVGRVFRVDQDVGRAVEVVDAQAAFGVRAASPSSASASG